MPNFSSLAGNFGWIYIDNWLAGFKIGQTRGGYLRSKPNYLSKYGHFSHGGGGHGSQGVGEGKANVQSF